MPTMTDDEKLAEHCANFDSMTMDISPHGGHLVVVPEHEGVKVCWQCGKPFAYDGPFQMVEKYPKNSTVPCAVHARCAFGPEKTFFAMSERTVMKVAAGIKQLNVSKKILAVSHKLADAAREGAKKIIA